MALALEMRDVLRGWIVGVSSEHAHVGAAADTSTALVTKTVLASLFHKMPSDAVVADVATRRDLEVDFELIEHEDYEAFEIRPRKTLS